MIELGELETHQEDFAKRHTRVVAVSVDDPEKAKGTKENHPHLVIVADPDRKLISAAEVLHPGAGEHGEDVAAPTTFLIDKNGMVRAVFRPRQVVTRLSAKEVLAAVDAELGETK
jgi:peroxiredoxin